MNFDLYLLSLPPVNLYSLNLLFSRTTRERALSGSLLLSKATEAKQNKQGERLEKLERMLEIMEERG